MIFRIRARIVTRAKENKIIKEPGGAWKLRVTAAPSGGKANEQVIELIAKEFATAKSNIEIVHGLTSRDKVIEVSL